MPTKRTLAGAAAFAFALAGGGVAGAVMGTPGTTTQDDTDTTASDEVRGHHRGEHLATVAEVLGISEDDLRAALVDGQSIAEVAEAEGVDPQEVVDALVADATARLDELEASLPDRMTDLVNREGWGDGPGGRFGHALEAGLDIAAETIGISEDDLLDALQEGETLAEVATANGVEPQAVIDALVAATNERIDAAVAEGNLDADRAAELKETAVERITQRVNEGGPLHGGGRGPHHGGPFGHGPMARPDLDPDSGSDAS